MKKVCKKCFLLILTACMLFTSVPAMAAEEVTVNAPVVTGASSVKNGWVKEKAGYCYYEKGKKLVNTWKVIGSKRYYLGYNGVRKTGWYTIGNVSYYFNSQGVYQKRKKIDAVLIKTIDNILKSGKISESTADSTAIKKLFTYCTQKYKYQRVMGFKPTSGWEYNYAKQMLITRKGSCYHDAAAFAFLVKRATGLPVRICIGTSNAFNSKKWQAHGWVEIKAGNTWYTYDTNANRFSSLRKGKWYQQKRSAMEGKVYKTQKVFDVTL